MWKWRQIQISDLQDNIEKMDIYSQEEEDVTSLELMKMPEDVTVSESIDVMTAIDRADERMNEVRSLKIST